MYLRKVSPPLEARLLGFVLDADILRCTPRWVGLCTWELPAAAPSLPAILRSDRDDPDREPSDSGCFFRRVKEMERKEIGLVFSLIGSAYPGAGTQNWTNKIKPICKRLKLNSISCWTIETPRHFGRVGNWIVYATNHLMMSKVATFYHLSFQRRRSCKAVPLKYDTVRCKWMIAINFPADSMAAK